MTRILIVDDDRNYRYALKSILPWENQGFCIVAEAVHGRQALSVLDYTPVEIIITDISMPQMNGVELIKIVKQEYPAIEIIALSSYDDFEFVKEAMKCGARDYILKYEMCADDILRVVNEARAQIELSHDYPSLDRLPSGSRNYLISSLLRSFVGDLQHNDEQVRHFFNLHNIHDKSPQLGVMVADKDGVIPSHAVEQFAKAQASPAFCFESDEHRLVLIVNLHNISSTQEVYRYLISSAQDFCSMAHQYGIYLINIGIGSIALGYLGILKSYKQAIEALEQQLYGDRGRICCFDELPRRQADMARINSAGQMLTDAFSEEKEIPAADALDSFWSVILGEKPPIKQLNDILQDICVTIYNSLAIKAVGQSISMPKMQELSDSIAAARSVNDKQELLRCLLDTWVRQFYLSSGYSLKVRQAIDYMERCYRENLSVNDIAIQIDLSPNYLSSIFNTETGERITEYLNRIRVEQSKRLIKEGKLKNYEIAKIVGFESASYFSATFKKVTGKTIQQFKG